MEEWDEDYLNEEIFEGEQKAVNYFMDGSCKDEESDSLRIYIQQLYDERGRRQEEEDKND
jgi:hypothetical protein